ELALPCQRRTGAPADEVALFEDAPVDVRVTDQLLDGAGPEDPAHHRGRLQCRLGGGREQVDPRGQHRVHGVRNDEVRRWLTHDPTLAYARPQQQATVDERGQQLLEEERV